VNLARFEFATAQRILFGAGTRSEVAPIVAALGKRALVVTGSHVERADGLAAALAARSVGAVRFAVAGEPTLECIAAGLARGRESGCDCVVGWGGGSAIDAAKAIAGLAPHPGDLLEYVEVVGRARPLPGPGLPCVAVPTTAGTGSEVTRNAVLGCPEQRVKASVRSPHLLPRAAVVDPELTRDLPPALTATTGLDALTQLIEPYVSIRANPLVDVLCVEGIRRAARSLRRAFEDGSDAGAREDMALASLFGGLALANSGLGAVHGFAAPLGGLFPAAHGAVCAALLPHALAVNARALAERQPGSPALGRYDEVARLLTGRPQATVADGVAWVRDLCAALAIPNLGRQGVTEAALAGIVTRAAQASSMKANPIPLTPAEMTEILRAAL
jgi:alcohol dehydrogenase class IV